MIAGLLRRRGYRLHPPDSPEAEALLTERGLTRADLDHAIAELARTEDIAIRTIVGINDDGVFGSRRKGWRADLPDACAEPFIPLLWLQVLELLGRVPRGQHGKVPRRRHPARLTVNARRYAAAASRRRRSLFRHLSGSQNEAEPHPWSRPATGLVPPEPCQSLRNGRS